MPQPPLVSVVISSAAPEPFLLEAIASVEAQSYSRWEIVVVDDGAGRSDSGGFLERVERSRVRLVRQADRGPAAARNAGFRSARGRYVVPLDADDLLEPGMIAACLAELREYPETGFVYCDCRVLGNAYSLETPGEYNLYRLLDEDYIPGCCLIAKDAWERVGGYDESFQEGVGNWCFYLDLGRGGFHGRYVQKPLLRRRAAGPESRAAAPQWSRARMEQARPEAFSHAVRLAVKREWAPSVCVVQERGRGLDLSEQTLEDYQILAGVSEQQALASSGAPCFLWLAGDAALKPQTLEECVWGLRAADWVTWRDTGAAPPPSLERCAGPLGVSRRTMEKPESKRSGRVRRLPWSCRLARAVSPPARAEAASPRSVLSVPRASPYGLLRHLRNTELLEFEVWFRRPVHSLLRLIPLKVKERVNALAGKAVFDLRFYLKLQPRSVLIAGKLIASVDYLPPPKGKRKRIGLFIPTLETDEAEIVLREIVSQIDRSRVEIVLAAMDSEGSRRFPQWHQAADRVYDAAKLVPLEQTTQFLYSLALNWELDALLLQDAPVAYTLLPALKEKLLRLRTADVLRAVDENWDMFAASLDVAESVDRRVTVSEAGKNRLWEMNIPEQRIVPIPNGVDTDSFRPAAGQGGELRARLGVGREQMAIAFIGRLDSAKRPLLLPPVARELSRVAPDLDYVIVVAGEGPQEAALCAKVDRRLSDRFRLIGAADRPQDVLAAADVLLILSTAEAVPPVLLESLAMETPVVACRVGAMEETLPDTVGVLVEPGPYEETRLAETLAELLADESRRAAMAKNGRALVKRRHDLRTVRERYRSLLEYLLRL